MHTPNIMQTANKESVCYLGRGPCVGPNSLQWGPAAKSPMNKRSGAICCTLEKKSIVVNMILCNVVIVFTFECFALSPPLTLDNVVCALGPERSRLGSLEFFGDPRFWSKL